MDTKGKVEELALLKVAEAQTLIDITEGLEKNHVKGAHKLKKRIKAEIRFLGKGLQKESELKLDHVLCSNLGQLGAMLEVATTVPNVTGILQPFSISGYEKIVVDVVADSGKQWIKVIMRNPKALHLLYISGGRNGTKPLDEVADDFLICADQHLVFYSAPKVVFWFSSGVSEGLASALEERGVQVIGQRILDHLLGLPDLPLYGSDSEEDEEEEEEEDCDSCSSNQGDEDFQDEKSLHKEKNGKLAIHCEGSNESGYIISPPSSPDDDGEVTKCQFSTTQVPLTDHSLHSDCHQQKCTSQNENSVEVSTGKEEIVRKLNLDVTAMIAYVSSTANGGANFVFKEKLLSEQAKWERKYPVKETLEAYFKGRELMACQEAVDHFMTIIGNIGGPEEQARAKDLVARLTVVPGSDFLKNKVHLGGKVRELARMVFGTGHVHRAITVSSNGNFVRSAAQQGVNLAVLFHQARALTEIRECTASSL
ncbi:hypothetical protein Pcinc_032559 [Petrolisthes cinctipes]|uniref:DUF1308 domain-containing protein n=1 Tax=Petrolisthes cinctipes TaxID=88211 RepID=A0AAE1K0L8_PETCI|nr:hypothetical protein Pcinc_032559 [Petrolisthes cinctipes]